MFSKKNKLNIFLGYILLIFCIILLSGQANPNFITRYEVNSNLSILPYICPGVFETEVIDANGNVYFLALKANDNSDNTLSINKYEKQTNKVKTQNIFRDNLNPLLSYDYYLKLDNDYIELYLTAIKKGEVQLEIYKFDKRLDLIESKKIDIEKTSAFYMYKLDDEIYVSNGNNSVINIKNYENKKIISDDLITVFHESLISSNSNEDKKLIEMNILKELLLNYSEFSTLGNRIIATNGKTSQIIDIANLQRINNDEHKLSFNTNENFYKGKFEKIPFSNGRIRMEILKYDFNFNEIDKRIFVFEINKDLSSPLFNLEILTFFFNKIGNDLIISGNSSKNEKIVITLGDF